MNPKQTLIWIIQIIAFICYAKGSYRIYYARIRYLRWLYLGLLFDLTVVASMFFLNNEASTLRQSQLFWPHVVLASSGLLGFFCIILYGSWLRYHDVRRIYNCRVRISTYRYILPIWCLGVLIPIIHHLCH
jgi:hypothetical protein